MPQDVGGPSGRESYECRVGRARPFSGGVRPRWADRAAVRAAVDPGSRRDRRGAPGEGLARAPGRIAGAGVVPADPGAEGGPIWIATRGEELVTEVRRRRHRASVPVGRLGEARNDPQRAEAVILPQHVDPAGEPGLEAARLGDRRGSGYRHSRGQETGCCDDADCDPRAHEPCIGGRTRSLTPPSGWPGKLSLLRLVAVADTSRMERSDGPDRFGTIGPAVDRKGH